MLPKLVIVLKWFRLVRCRFEYELYFLCDLDHDTILL